MAGKNRFNRIVTGDTDVDAALETWVSGIETAGNITVSPPLVAQTGPSGTHLGLIKPLRKFAKLTTAGAGGAYAWTEVYRDRSTGAWALQPGGLSRTTTVDPAQEINAYTALTLPAYVELRFDADSGRWLFQIGGCS
ncbi:hypothetical protein ACYOEI_01590 [Singulisphaera rosea]